MMVQLRGKACEAQSSLAQEDIIKDTIVALICRWSFSVSFQLLTINNTET